MNAISGIFFNLNACLTDSLMQDIAQKRVPETDFIQPRYLYEPATFRTGKTSSRAKATLNLNQEQAMLLENTWKAFIDGGSKPRRCRPRTFQRDFHRTR